MTKEECDYIYSKSLELFKFGQSIADKVVILVDTKYEFGKDYDDNIIQLMNYIHVIHHDIVKKII